MAREVSRPTSVKGEHLILEMATVIHAAANACTATSAPATCQPSWLDTGSNSWQLTAATFVGLMSVPGLAVLYGGLVPKKWVVNTMFMTFSGFAMVLVVWVLWGYKMGFGSPLGGGSADVYNYTYTPAKIMNGVFLPGSEPEAKLELTHAPPTNGSKIAYPTVEFTAQESYCNGLPNVSTNDCDVQRNEQTWIPSGSGKSVCNVAKNVCETK